MEGGQFTAPSSTHVEYVSLNEKVKLNTDLRREWKQAIIDLKCLKSLTSLNIEHEGITCIDRISLYRAILDTTLVPSKIDIPCPGTALAEYDPDQGKKEPSLEELALIGREWKLWNQLFTRIAPTLEYFHFSVCRTVHPEFRDEFDQFCSHISKCQHLYEFAYYSTQEVDDNQIRFFQSVAKCGVLNTVRFYAEESPIMLTVGSTF